MFCIYYAGNYRAIMNSDDTGTGINTLRLDVGRSHLASRGIYCKVENEAMKEPARLLVNLNVNGEYYWSSRRSTPSVKVIFFIFQIFFALRKS